MKKNQKTNSKERFQELIGIIKIGLQDFRMRKDEPDKYRFRLGMFLNELKELNKWYQYYETFSDLCRQELSISSNYAYKQIRCYKKDYLHKALSGKSHPQQNTLWMGLGYLPIIGQKQSSSSDVLASSNSVPHEQHR